ncbi:type II toxin-antitoxin system RelE/ParE family toxin [Candidatus Entotheonella palauensis]|uniref:Plasmid stabilization protein n=1 Tax=Candidatus Entotheonella gemina TaxID=1429439 RepID=W4MEK7_9BACT|nr:type II toxin-antitoxin system RelE/ParE family toxin [Candidatus Entotheonella palauensis]ETX08648.1 MAG: hypothetical protein ETSY2_04165 [Candidatus Entotheonella gemina]
MTYTLRFLPDVEEDIMEGYTWYEEQASGLGEDFLRMFYASTGEIHRNPLMYSKVYYEFRRCLLRRFPYAIYFRLEDSEIIVFGFFHSARNPQAIQAQLRGRDQPGSS